MERASDIFSNSVILRNILVFLHADDVLCLQQSEICDPVLLDHFMRVSYFYQEYHRIRNRVANSLSILLENDSFLRSVKRKCLEIENSLTREFTWSCFQSEHDSLNDWQMHLLFQIDSVRDHLAMTDCTLQQLAASSQITFKWPRDLDETNICNKIRILTALAMEYRRTSVEMCVRMGAKLNKILLANFWAHVAHTGNNRHALGWWGPLDA